MLASRIILTLSYSAQFSFPLTTLEVWSRLIGEKASFIEVEETLQDLVRQKKIFSSTRYELEVWSTLPEAFWVPRVSTAERSQQKIRSADRLTWLAEALPWVEGLAVTGSVAVKNAAKNADLDLLVVTRPNRLWITRLLFTFLAFISGKRRSWQREEPNSWCFNLWLTTQTVSMPQQLHTLYGAYEVLQAEWLVSKRGVRLSWLKSNKWVGSILETFYQTEIELAQIDLAAGEFSRTLLRLQQFLLALISPFLTVCEWGAYALQRLYMQRHITREKVGYKAAFFHPRDTQKLLLSQFAQQVERWAVYLSKNTTLEQLRPNCTASDAWKEQLEQLRRSGGLVLVTGVFDLLHSEHRKFLIAAKKAGKKLVVALESDVRVRQIKGEGRPIQNQWQRASSVVVLPSVDLVCILPDNFSSPKQHRNFIEFISPDILAVSEHTSHLDKKRAIVEKVGGTLQVVLPHNPAISTTGFLKSRGEE